ncbi:Snf7 family [Dillenia turbinata]|uniref:Snf7 family n=1 Tax=Dillenia turbinata TaxID=194707 RepID=A0AAN8VKX6_9MAGN
MGAKSGFFHEDNKAFQVDPKTGMLLNTDNDTPMPQNLHDEMMDLMDVSNEIQESLRRSYSVPDDIDKEELMGELDALEADMGMETESDGVPPYRQPDKEPDLDAELNFLQHLGSCSSSCWKIQYTDLYSM